MACNGIPPKGGVNMPQCHVRCQTYNEKIAKNCAEASSGGIEGRIPLPPLLSYLAEHWAQAQGLFKGVTGNQECWIPDRSSYTGSGGSAWFWPQFPRCKCYRYTRVHSGCRVSGQSEARGRTVLDRANSPGISREHSTRHR